MTEDLPEELDRIGANPGVANVLSRVFSGQMVAFHPEKGLVAVWTGGTGVNVYDPGQWSESSYNGAETGEVYHFNIPDPSQLDVPSEYAKMKLEGYGFEVVGE